ncbi:hypothetical protein CHLNCDRAFT_138890 [Chlorella variabilis]|uniref:Glycosyl transferase CAP10 domain-containing protein n=1 Tax=Chlorella variabilis TaxID=554065 RepID=E1ZNV7_CHLVA|nr:hypothetical protein CHLNCDRAFT_138890 [Chlorella variabilis]EFN52413.1 hypothetical protein CHLNCDRAFT_138890 [Chlorella variabilis]|eukprot:XP_005844515.1 hypothetical protein CHLNCDRAFT_138890 [Chlorella variabilis]
MNPAEKRPLVASQHPPSARRHLPGAAAAALVLLVVGGLVLVARDSGGWQPAAALQRGGACPVQMCPPCAETTSVEPKECIPQADVEAAAAAAAAEQCPPCEELECPPPPKCPAAAPGQEAGQDALQAAAAPAPAPAAAAAAGPAARSGRGGGGQQAGAEALCGGPGAIPRVADALADSSRRMAEGVRESFARWDDTGFTLEDLLDTAAALRIDGTHDTQVWVEVRNNTLVLPRRYGLRCTWYCNEWLKPALTVFNARMAAGKLRLPEGLVMLWNVYDYSACSKDVQSGHSVCSAPLLSVIRHQNDDDVMVPNFHLNNRAPYEPHSVPWDEKADLAFFRGTPWCNVHPLNGTRFVEGGNCSREHLPLLTLRHPDLLNATINSDHHRAQGVYGPPATHYEHAWYKYLINLDGITASSRFATLLSINSLVLKQASPYQQWYYRAVKPCVHYLEFWRDSETDVLDLVRTLRQPANQAVAQRLAANAQAFAAAHLSEEGYWQYWQSVLDRYVELYRGSKDPVAATAARAAAERKGRHASKAGQEAEEQCYQRGDDNCWMVGRDAGRDAAQAWDDKHAAKGGDAGTKQQQGQQRAEEEEEPEGEQQEEQQEGEQRQQLEEEEQQQPKKKQKKEGAEKRVAGGSKEEALLAKEEQQEGSDKNEQ